MSSTVSKSEKHLHKKKLVNICVDMKDKEKITYVTKYVPKTLKLRVTLSITMLCWLIWILRFQQVNSV